MFPSETPAEVATSRSPVPWKPRFEKSPSAARRIFSRCSAVSSARGRPGPRRRARDLANERSFMECDLRTRTARGQDRFRNSRPQLGPQRGHARANIGSLLGARQELEITLEIGERAGVVALPLAGEAAVQPRVGQLRFELDGPR